MDPQKPAKPALRFVKIEHRRRQHHFNDLCRASLGSLCTGLSAKTPSTTCAEAPWRTTPGSSRPGSPAVSSSPGAEVASLRAVTSRGQRQAAAGKHRSLGKLMQGKLMQAKSIHPGHGPERRNCLLQGRLAEETPGPVWPTAGPGHRTAPVPARLTRELLRFEKLLHCDAADARRRQELPRPRTR